MDVQERIRKAAALGDLSENAEYHFAKEENRRIERELAELELKLRKVAVVATDSTRCTASHATGNDAGNARSTHAGKSRSTVAVVSFRR